MKTGTLFGIIIMIGKSLKQHALSTMITILSCALATGLVISVFSIQAQTEEAFTSGTIGFDAVLGARGSQLQLVLNSVFHLETSPGNIPWKLYQSIKADPRVKFAVPYAVGDNYHGFRIVGTIPELFENLNEEAKNFFQLEPGGKWFDSAKREAVVGSYAAQRTGLKPGAIFNPYHGLIFNEKMKHDEQFVVTGILKPTNTPSDRVIWIPVESFYRMKGHVLRGSGAEYTPKTGEQIPDDSKEISAVMIKLHSPQGGFMLDQMINRQGKVATFAWPIGRVMEELFEKIGWMHQVLALVGYIMIVVVGGAILASIYNTINERRRDFAIMRALGAHRNVIFSVVIAESAVISAVGSLLGFLFYFLIINVTAVIMRSQTGIVLDIFWFHKSIILVPVGITLTGALAGVIPALKAYQTDVATYLTPIS